jgi:hypothetical protein
MKYIVLTILISVCLSSLKGQNSDTSLVGVKFSIISEALKKLTLLENINFEKANTVIYLNSSYQEVRISSGAGGRFVHLDTILPDPFLYEMLVENYKYIRSPYHISLRSSTSTSIYRGDLIRLENFYKNYSDSNNRKVFIQIQAPIDNWEGMYLIRECQSHTSFFLEKCDDYKYSNSNIYMPVYYWYKDTRMEKQKNLLIQFKILKGNKPFEISYQYVNTITL